MARVDFNKKKVAKQVNNSASKFIRKIALDGMRQLIRQSPLDTGRFKANWSTSINNMDLGTTESTTAAFSSQSQAIRYYKLGQTMFLHNNLEYAMPLEYGTSKQAPRGWVRNTAIQMQKKMNEIKDLI